MSASASRRASSAPLATSLSHPLVQQRRRSLPLTFKPWQGYPTDWDDLGTKVLAKRASIRTWFYRLLQKVSLMAHYLEYYIKHLAHLSSILVSTALWPISLLFTFHPLQIVFDWIIAILLLIVMIGLTITWGVSQISPLTSLVVSSLVTNSGLCRVPYVTKIDVFQLCSVSESVTILTNSTLHAEQFIESLDRVCDGWKDILETSSSLLALPFALRKSKADYDTLADQFRYSMVPLPGRDELISALEHLSDSMSDQSDYLINFHYALIQTFNSLAAVTGYTKHQISKAEDRHAASVAGTGFFHFFTQSKLEAEMMIVKREYLAHCVIVLAELGDLLEIADKVLHLLTKGHSDLSAVNKQIFWINERSISASPTTMISASAVPSKAWWNGVWFWSNTPKKSKPDLVLPPPNLHEAARLSAQATGYAELVRSFVVDRRYAWEKFKQQLERTSFVDSGEMAVEVHLKILTSQMQWYQALADKARKSTLEYVGVPR